MKVRTGWVDPDPIKLATAHGLTVLLYRRAPSDQQDTSEPPPMPQQPLPYFDAEEPAWVKRLDEQERLRQATAELPPATRRAMGLDDPHDPGAA